MCVCKVCMTMSACHTPSHTHLNIYNSTVCPMMTKAKCREAGQKAAAEWRSQQKDCATQTCMTVASLTDSPLPCPSQRDALNVMAHSSQPDVPSMSWQKSTYQGFYSHRISVKPQTLPCICTYATIPVKDLHGM